MTPEKKSQCQRVLLPILEDVHQLYELGMSDKEIVESALCQIDDVARGELAELWTELTKDFK